MTTRRFFFFTLLLVVVAVLIGQLWPQPYEAVIKAIQQHDLPQLHNEIRSALLQLQRQHPAHNVSINDLVFSASRHILHVTAMTGNLAILQYLFNTYSPLPIDVRKPSDDRTPLHIACIFNSPDFVDQLIEYGASVAARSHAGWSPLLFAVLWSNHDIVRVLLKHDSTVIHQRLNDNGFNAAQLAIVYSDSKMIDLVISAGAELSEGEKYYEDWLAYKRHIEERLLMYGSKSSRSHDET